MNRILIFLLYVITSTGCMAQSRAKAAPFKVQGRNGEVLAYSESSNMHEDQLPDFIRELLAEYQHGGKRYAQRSIGKRVEPLLKSTRTQEYPYNLSTPYYIYSDGSVSEEHCVAGCVATALEQVVSYWRHPSELKDTLFGWKTDNYVVDTIYPGTKIDWDNILVNYKDGRFNQAQAKAIADLTYYLGIAAHMNWTPSSSGANLARAFNPLYDAFDYRTLYLVQRGLFSPQAWNALLRNELECGRPIVYIGHNYRMGGHCFNIDGVDEEGYYHMNWGEKDWTLYLDLDYMNPYERIDDPTLLGAHFGMFSNQAALFMHPDDFEIDIHDSLRRDDAFRSVEVEDVQFSRSPDAQGYVRADFYLHNTSQDSLNYTFEVFTYLPTDTAIFMQADFVGLTAVNLAPNEKKKWPVYCRFNEVGDRIFACSADDKTMPYTKDITIARGTSPKYVFGTPSVQLLRFRNPDGTDDLTARIQFDFANEAADGGCANALTYQLFEGDSEDDVRHFNILQVMAGETIRESVDFHHLIDGQSYKFQATFQAKAVMPLEFVVRAEEAVDRVGDVTATPLDETHHLFYDMSGRPVVVPGRGIYFSRGKKYIFH